jgi:hypothetical protein
LANVGELLANPPAERMDREAAMAAARAALRGAAGEDTTTEEEA